MISFPGGRGRWVDGGGAEGREGQQGSLGSQEVWGEGEQNRSGSSAGDTALGGGCKYSSSGFRKKRGGKRPVGATSAFKVSTELCQ